nr:hypothetical protein Iba_chr15cCG0220 [Ipomoea batatas]
MSNTLSNSFKPSKMNNSIKLCLRKQLFQIILVSDITLQEMKILGELGSNQFSDPLNSFFYSVVKIINDPNYEAFIKKLNHGVGTYEPSPTSHQNRFLPTHHHSRFFLCELRFLIV